jgi:hypothetical protein
MYWYVRRKFSKGALLTQTLFAQQEEVLGCLSIAEERDAETRRTTKVARLLEHLHYPATMPLPLFEAAVIHAGRGAWTVSGYEREGEGTCGQRSYLQSWFMRPMSAREEVQLEERFVHELHARLPPGLRPEEWPASAQPLGQAAPRR